MGFAELPECFTLQSCFGHFVWLPGQDIDNIDRLPADHDGEITYRIAYMALCLENSARGRDMRDSLEGVAAIDPEYIQFGSANWFWDRHPNSYALQVEPVRYRDRDQVAVSHPEALRIEKARHLFFAEVRALLRAHTGNGRGL